MSPAMSQDKVLLTRRNRNWNNSHLLSPAGPSDFDYVDHRPLTSPGPVPVVTEQAGVLRRGVTDASPVVPLTGDRSGAVSFSPELAQSSGRSPEEETESLPNFTKLDLFICLYSIVSYVLDVGSDIWLAIHYFRKGQTAFFTMTLAPPIIASIIMTTLSLTWYHVDTKNGRETLIPRWRWTIRIFFHVLQMGPLIRYADTVCYGLKSKRQSLAYTERKRFKILRLYEDADAALLRMIECFFEAAPQLILQLYIIIIQGQSQEYTKLLFQYGSCLLSWNSLVWSFVSYQAALRSMRTDKNDLSWTGIIFLYMWRLLVLGPRILAIALFVSVYREWIFILLTFHVLIMFAWVVLQRTNFCEGACRQVKEVLWNLVVAVIYCFDFLAVKEGRTRVKYLIYYTIHYLENVTLILFWHFRVLDLGRCCNWEHWTRFASALGLFWIGLCFMFAYYLFFHPTGGVPCCLGCTPSWTPRIGEARRSQAARAGHGDGRSERDGAAAAKGAGTSSSSSNPIHVGTSSSHSRSVSSPSGDPTERTISPEFMSCHNGQFVEHHQSFV